MLALLVFSIGVYGLQYCGAQMVAAAIRPRRRRRRVLGWGAGLCLCVAAIRDVPVAPAASDAVATTETRELR